MTDSARPEVARTVPLDAGVEISIPKERKSGDWTPYLLSLPSLLVLIGILGPFLLGIYTSFTRFSLFNPVYSFAGLDNYIRLFSSMRFWNSTLITLAYAFGVVLVEAVLGLILALLMDTDVFMARVLRLFLLFPLMIPPIVGVIMWLLMINPDYGVLTYFLHLVGIEHFQWLNSQRWALPTVMLIDVWMFTPFFALLLLAGLRSRPKSQLEAAQVDGASPWFTFREITLPLIMPFLLIAVVFRLIDSINQFDLIYGTTQGGPGDATLNYGINAYITGFPQMEMARAMAIMFINWIVVYIFSNYLIKYWSKARSRLS